MDGIDVALLETDGHQFIRSIDHHFQPYTTAMHQQLKALESSYQRHYQTHPHPNKIPSNACIDEVTAQSSSLHCQAIQTLLSRHTIQPDVIGYHGQTMYHNPRHALSIQIGDAKQLAQTLQVPVVHQFRQQDLQEGGQGAPLAPLYHQAIATQLNLPLPLGFLNLGGIANISVITGDGLLDVYARDIGPANVLIDRWVRMKTNQGAHFDQNSQWAKQGHCHEDYFDILDTLHSEIMGPPHCALDSANFSWPNSFHTLSLEDGCATLTQWTAKFLIQQLQAMKPSVNRWLASGGGCRNPCLFSALQTALPIETMNTYYGHEAAIEAEAFAYLAARHLKGLPLSTPHTTGVLSPCIGGELIEPLS